MQYKSLSLRLVQKIGAVEKARAKYRMSERWACRLLDQCRGTQRNTPQWRGDEDALTAAIIELAGKYGRYRAARGLEVSLGDVFQHLLLEGEFGHQPPELKILPLQLLQPLGLAEPWSDHERICRHLRIVGEHYKLCGGAEWL